MRLSLALGVLALALLCVLALHTSSRAAQDAAFALEHPAEAADIRTLELQDAAHARTLTHRTLLATIGGIVAVNTAWAAAWAAVKRPRRPVQLVAPPGYLQRLED